MLRVELTSELGWTEQGRQLSAWIDLARHARASGQKMPAGSAVAASGLELCGSESRALIITALLALGAEIICLLQLLGRLACTASPTPGTAGIGSFCCSSLVS